MVLVKAPKENFDAGQYAFFGKDSLEGLDLGCLEDDDGDSNGGGFSAPEEGLYLLSSVGEEIDNMSNLSDIDDLASTFAKAYKSRQTRVHARQRRRRGGAGTPDQIQPHPHVGCRQAHCHRRRGHACRLLVIRLRAQPLQPWIIEIWNYQPLQLRIIGKFELHSLNLTKFMNHS